MVGFLEKFGQDAANAVDKRLDGRSSGEDLGSNHQCDPRRHGKRRAGTRLQKKFYRCGGKTQVVQPYITPDRLYMFDLDAEIDHALSPFTGGSLSATKSAASSAVIARWLSLWRSRKRQYW